MGNFLRSMDIAASGLTAQRLRMDIIAENMANVSTTRTADGNVYQRRYTVFQEQTESFAAIFNDMRNGTIGKGVKVVKIGTDESEGKLDFDPTHPDADENGYVHLPNVDSVREMLDMMDATRAYEANITSFNALKAMAMKGLEIGK